MCHRIHVGIGKFGTDTDCCLVLYDMHKKFGMRTYIIFNRIVQAFPDPASSHPSSLWHLAEHFEYQDHRKNSDWKGSQVIVVHHLPCEVTSFLSGGVESLCSNNAFSIKVNSINLLGDYCMQITLASSKSLKPTLK